MLRFRRRLWVWCLTRFHECVYGQPVIAKSDHKPLLAIAEKDYNDISPKIQPMMMRMQRYDLT